jgi:STE24 endopeptidase
VIVNYFAVIILGALVVGYLLDIVTNLLNLRALKLEIPSELEGVYQPEEYRRSQQYTRVNTRFEFLTSSFGLALILVFWFAGGFNFLDQLVRSWGFGPITTGLLYIGILLLGQSLIMLPFSIYETFIIEERFGFNKTTPGIFVLDRVKGLALMIVLGGGLLAAVLALFEYAGTIAWLYCWAAITVFTLVMQFIAPVWIMPLFNKFTPLEDKELKDSILGYAGSVGFPLKNVFVMDSSRRSSKSNAFFTGFGRNKRAVLFDTLIENHTTPELVAVLAHEIGHYKKKHILQGMIVSVLHTGFVFFLLSILLDSPALFEAFFMDVQSVYAGLLFFGLLYTPIEMVLSLVLHQVSRRNEYTADSLAAQTIEQPMSLASALKKLSADNLSNLTPHPFYVFLNYSHPPLLERVQAIQQHQRD